MLARHSPREAPRGSAKVDSTAPGFGSVKRTFEAIRPFGR